MPGKFDDIFTKKWCFFEVFVPTSKLKSVSRKLLAHSKWPGFTRQLSRGSSGDWFVRFFKKWQKMWIFTMFTVFSSRCQSNFMFLKLFKTVIQCSQASWFQLSNTINSWKSEKYNERRAENTDLFNVFFNDRPVFVLLSTGGIVRTFWWIWAFSMNSGHQISSIF